MRVVSSLLLRLAIWVAQLLFEQEVMMLLSVAPPLSEPLHPQAWAQMQPIRRRA